MSLEASCGFPEDENISTKKNLNCNEANE